MLRVLYCLRDQHDWRLVLLAAGVCLVSCIVAVLTLNRARTAEGAVRLRWMLACGAATGFGIWATHFIAMLAFNPGLPLAFDPRLTLASLLCAMLVTGGGVHIVISGDKAADRLTGGAVIGTGVCTMHYLGMWALDVPGHVSWRPDLIAASLLFGTGLGALAMLPLNGERQMWRKAAAAGLLVLAIVSHHFTAMGAVALVPDPTHIPGGMSLSAGSMSMAIALAALVVLGLCLHALAWGRRLDQVRTDADRRLSALLGGVEDYAIFMLDPDGLVLDWNAGAERIKGYTAAEAVGRQFTALCGMDATAAARHAAGLETARQDGRYETEFTGKRKDGTAYAGHAVITPVRDEHGRLIGYAHVSQDVTARKADSERILAMSRNLDAALSHMSHGLCLFDRNERLILANGRFAAMYSLDPAYLAPGLSFRALLTRIIAMRDGAEPDDATVEVFHTRHRELIARPNGGLFVSNFYADRTLSIAHRPLPEGGFVSTFDDITERRRNEERATHLARHDVLTGLANRAHFNDHLDEAVAAAARDARQLAVIAIDMDRFKAINDLKGHAVGDEVLKTLAARLTALAEGDGKFIARFGGDEFAAIKPFHTREALDDCMKILHRSLCEPIAVNGESVSLGASLGIALYPYDATNGEALLNNAGLALQRSKASASDKICYFDAAADEAARRRRVLSGDLERALKDEEFRVHYQVQQRVDTGEVTGYEALVRWLHPQRGMVSPCDFIPAAEESGAIIELGAWVLKTACAEAASWNNDLKIAVNLSPVQLGDVNLIETVREVLAQTGLSPRRLELEITETTIIEDRVRALHILRQIKALGVTIAIDDFGTGYASLDTLNAFPFDKIKIDRGFLMQADTSPQARAIVRSILALGRSLGIPVLAEGVETQSQLELLREEGCAEAQGYLLGRPQADVLPPALRAAG